MFRAKLYSKFSSLNLGSPDLVAFRLASLTANFLMIPILMTYLGSKVLGLYYFLYALFCFFSFFDLGIGNGLIGLIAKSQSKHSVRMISILSAKILMQVGIFFSLSLSLPLIIMVNKGSLIGKYGSEKFFTVSIFIVLLSSFLSNVGNISNKIRSGLGNYGYAIKYETLIVFLSIALTIFGLNFYPSLIMVVLGMIFFPSLFSIINLFRLFGYLRNHVEVDGEKSAEPTPGAFDIVKASRLFFLLQFTTTVGFQLDNLIVGLMLQPIDVTNLSVTWKIFSTPYVLFTSLVGGLWAFSAKNLAEASFLEVRGYFIKSAKVAFIFSLPFAICFLILGPSILRLLVPSLGVPSHGIIITSCLLLPVMCVCQPLAMILNGLHREKFLVTTAIISVFLNIFFSVLFIRISGEPYGALLGTLFAQVMGFLLPFLINIRSQKISQLGIGWIHL